MPVPGQDVLSRHLGQTATPQYSSHPVLLSQKAISENELRKPRAEDRVPESNRKQLMRALQAKSDVMQKEPVHVSKLASLVAVVLGVGPMRYWNARKKQ